LLEEGAFLTYQDAIGMTPLHHAAFHGHTSMVFLLLEADHEVGGARDVRDNAGNLPLDWAYENRHKESAKLLRFGLDNDYMSDDEYLYW
jgi:ankyrin repeat protein